MNANEQLFRKFGKVVPAGTVLFREGDTTSEVFILQAGRVKITRRIRDVEKLLDVMSEPGEFFGELSFINGRPRFATATAVSECRLLVIDPALFEKMLLSNHEISFRFIRKLAARLEDADLQIENLLYRETESRVVHALVQIVKRTAKQKAEKIAVDVEYLSGWAGLARKDVEGVLAKLAGKGMVTVSGGEVLAGSAEILKTYLDFIDMKARFEA
jgi:CRP-like cAMP-binding protein